jgi:hypothetical protein
MATLPEIVNWLEGDDSLHLGRLLVLLEAFGGRRGDQPIEGLTKLAKLDFLLRYPVYLERAWRTMSGIRWRRTWCGSGTGRGIIATGAF